jgi:hypothetical protein
MARLVCPPTLSRFAASASTTAKPAAGRSVSQRAPIQSVSSRTKTSAARYSLIHSASSRTTLSAVSNALQQTRSARHVPAVTSRTYHAACIRALDLKTSFHKATTNREQNNVHLQTRIPCPRLTSKAHTKLAKVRQFVSLVYKTVATNINNKANDDITATAEDFDEVEAESEDGDTVIEIDNNPNLLNDVSFDEAIDGYQQSYMQSQLAKFELLSATIRQGGRTVKCPAYGGADSFILGRKRPRTPSAELVTKKVAPTSKIPRMNKTTLKYRGKSLRCTSMGRWSKTNNTLAINLTTAPPALTVEQAKSAARFGYNVKSDSQSAHEVDSFSMPDPTHSPTIEAVTPKSEQPLSPLPDACRKVVRFQEDPVQPLLFDLQAPTNNLKSVLDVDNDLTPLKLDRHSHGCSQATGRKSMFAPTSLQTISLKRGIPARFKAVQEYEKRRKQESLAAGDHPALGQLEYGNADFKLALQPTKIITAHDIGCFKTPNELGIPVSVCSSIIGLLLHFGGFQDDMGRTFEDVPIPHTRTAAYKKPIDWKQAPTEQAPLEDWVREHFTAMQPTDLAG